MTATKSPAFRVGQRIKLSGSAVRATDGNTYDLPPIGNVFADVESQNDSGSYNLLVHIPQSDGTVKSVSGRGFSADRIEAVRGKPFIPGVDERRLQEVRKARATGDDEEIAEISAGLSAAEVAEIVRTEAAALDTVMLERITAKVVAVVDTVADSCDAEIAAIKAQLAEEAEKVMMPLRALAETAVLDPTARARIALAVKGSDNPILDKLIPFYQAGQEAPANVLVCSPPSLGKSFAIRQLGQTYDHYLEHGCSDDLDEVSTLLGNPVPDGKGGFIVVDGVLTEAMRLAGGGKTVLLLLDEVLRLSPRAQEWLLTFLTGVKTPSGRRYRLRTRRAMSCGTLEVLECATTHLHLVAATNLGLLTPVEAFWSRWETVRIDFSMPLAKDVAHNILSAYGVAGSDKKSAKELAKRFAEVVADSRKHVAEGRLRFPVDFRMLERACQLAKENTPKAVADYLAKRFADNTANWNVDTGDVDGDSLTHATKWTKDIIAEGL